MVPDPDRRMSALLPKAAALAAALALTAAGSAGAQEPKPPVIDNPAQYFQFACAACHGAEGKGDGPAAAQLVTPPSDLTRIARRNGGVFPAEQVYEKIEGLAMPQAHGTREMPIWGAVLLFEELGTSVAKEDAGKAARATRKRLEGLVDYLRSIQK